MGKIRCPNCSQKLDVPEDSGGKRAQCPKCKKILLIPREIANAADGSAVGQTAGDRPIKPRTTTEGKHASRPATEADQIDLSELLAGEPTSEAKAAPPPLARNDLELADTPDVRPTRNCPFCGEMILTFAKKCKHCGEFIDDLRKRGPGRPQDGAASSTLILPGYVCALVALLFLPPVFGAAAFILGILNLTRGHIGHGFAQLVLSGICTYFGMAIGAAVMFE